MTNNNFVSTRCPLCNSNEKEFVYPVKFERLNRCKKCNLLYTDPRLSKDNIKELYNFTYFNNSISNCFGYSNYLADENKIRKTFKQRLKDINKLFINKGRLLDLGCAAGFFIDEAQKDGWKTEGVELSSYMANYGSKIMNLKITNSDIEEYHFTKNKYDLITMWDTIEHLTNPLAILKKINLALKKNGVLIFSTPDVGSIPARTFGSSWIGFKLSDEHLSYFSKETINQISRLSNFNIIKCQHQGKFVSPSLFIDRMGMYNRYLANGLNFIKKILPNEFYINPFDIICVYAQKK